MAELNRIFMEDIKSILMKLDCEFADARFSVTDSSLISLTNDEIETISSGNSNIGSIRIYDRGRWGFASFNNFTEFERFAKNGLDNMKFIEPVDKKGIQKYKAIKINKKTDMKIDFTTMDIKDKMDLLIEYNDILKSNEKIQTTRAFYRDRDSRYFYLNSEGSEISYQKSFCGTALTAIAKEGSEIQPFNDSIAGYGGFELVQNQHEKAEQIVKTAVDLLSAEQVEGGQYSVVLDQRMSGVFVHEAFGHLSEADFVYSNDRMKKIMSLGSQFGPEILNIIDDGSMEDQTGYIPVDDEGILPQKTYLIKEGILNSRLHSRETAYMMNEEVTGNGRAISPSSLPIVRMTNTYIENGNSNKEDLFTSMEDGIYALNFHGGQTNLEMFTFSAAYGYEIKNGKKGRLLKNVILSGNVFDTLKNIRMISNDREHFGGLGGCGKMGQGPLPVSLGGPHILIDKVLIGGNQ